MKAIVCEEYGPPEVLQLREVERPVPRENELLIRVHAVFVGPEDTMQRTGKPYFVRGFIGLTRPRKPILGNEFAGEVVAVGQAATRFKRGDRVFGVTGAGFGCYAEYVCMPEAGLVSLKPPELSDEEVAPVCGALAAWDLLKATADTRRGQKVLVYGASGNTGLAAVQVAKVLGAEVTGVCSSSNFELVKSLGADHVVAGTLEEAARNGATYDVILDVSGRPPAFEFAKLLGKEGFYLTRYPTISILLQTFLSSRCKGRKVMFSATGLKPVSERSIFLGEVIQLWKAGKVRTVIDTSFSLEQMVEAHRHVERGLEKGNVVVSI
jgi:NADPH:quinone reductase-like Zn-dependent oxidoreductase